MAKKAKEDLFPARSLPSHKAREKETLLGIIPVNQMKCVYGVAYI
jgi:hypothetical protein